MDFHYIKDILHAIKRELFHFRFLAVVLFMVVTSGVLAYGYNAPKSYTADAVLHADSSTILAPLLDGAAEVNNAGQVNAARELIYSRSFLERVAIRANLLNGNAIENQRDAAIGSLANNISLRVTNRDYLNVSYTSDDPDKSFRVLSVLLDEFTKESARRKQSESRGAYEFIDSQVQAYQRQLENAENRLKEFRSNNVDGNTERVQNRVQNLTNAIEELTLRIEETESLIERTTQQLETEEPFREVTRQDGTSEVDERLRSMRQQLDSLRLMYHDTHPDIVTLRAQIEELEQQKEQGLASAEANTVTEVMENPVYEDLQVRLNKAESDLQAQRRRLASQQRLLETEMERAERVAAAQAEESDLMRDYNVTRQVYEEMLKRRENARLSMTLDVEGEGVNYKVQEPASFPSTWDGPQMVHYGTAGPVVGFGLVFGLLGALVMLDGRVRSGRALQKQLPEDVLMLTSVPQYNNSPTATLFRWDVIMLALVLVAFMVAYFSVLVFSIMDIEPAYLAELINEQVEGIRALI